MHIQSTTAFHQSLHDASREGDCCVAGPVESLKHYVYRSTHAELLRRRHEWFEKFSAAFFALWWVPVGHVPGIDEAKKRLAHLDKHGPTQFAFTFKKIFQPDEEFSAEN